ncbi:hypothetical protein FH972_023769 [Carpinus fangiana]|uniref:Uncharacterized protein n=1 Tax=Carpinus fangiana TaxID=176857 RepID=A0A5N6KW49_9ROSI|nr:hypothetical protein FH972_023769 [Carpinus fangiana]
MQLWLDSRRYGRHHEPGVRGIVLYAVSIPRLSRSPRGKVLVCRVHSATVVPIIMFRSPRYLVFRHAQRTRRNQGLEDKPDEDLKPGQEHLRSFFLPGLQARPYTIEVKQPVTAADGSAITLSTSQLFYVQEPRFVLPEGAIHTTYPPSGFTTTAETLPHVIFNNPTFPWERPGSEDADKTPPDDYSRNRTPWLAVFVFTADELKLAETDLSGNDSLFFDIPSLKDGVKQTSTFTVPVPANELTKIKSTTTPYTKNVAEDATAANTILLKRELFAGFFSKYSKQGAAENTPTPYVQHHRFLAHKRVINTEGMAESGAEGTDDTGSFGVVVSGRCGPPSITVPTPVYVHLVSIEGVEQMPGFPFDKSTRFVAMVSLASWSYVCLPPGTPSVRDEMITLGKSISPLSSSLTEATRDKIHQVANTGDRLLERLDQGYALSRYRAQSGEVTACFLRGPFVPVGKYTLPDGFPETSMVGSDLSILDRQLGLMDISYSAAWQLGRTMAISDQAFTTCLYRVRTQIIQRATALAEGKYVGRYTWRKDKEQLLSGLKDSIERLGLIAGANELRSNCSVRRRWMVEKVQPLDLSYHGEIVDAFVDSEFTKAAKEVASTPCPEDPSKPSEKPYNEFNAPFSADWVIVLRWVLDRFFFDSIPAHYFLPDASLLPQESLKFFDIDDNWMDCFLDGALSLGNHIDQQTDKVRDAIKTAIKWYLQTDLGDLKYPPPIPKYGCLIRSSLITQFPDLIVAVDPAPEAHPDVQPVLLRHEILDKGTMLCLFSQPPAPSTFTKLTFTQPPHQQSFIVGEKVTNEEVDVAYRRAYTVEDPADPDFRQPFDQPPWKRGEGNADRPIMFLWETVDSVSQANVNLHMLLMDNYAPDYNSQLMAKMPPSFYSDNMASSALMAWQLNNPSWMLPVDIPPGMLSPRISTRPRALPVHERTPPPPPKPPVSQKDDSRSCDDFLLYEERLVRKNYVPVAGGNPMGRFTRAQDLSWPPTRIPQPDDFADDNYPVIEFFFWSMEEPGTPQDPGSIPMLVDAKSKPLAQDLIFSINIVDNAYPSVQIDGIEIQIKQGPPSQMTKPSIGPLTQLYDGPGASMLSNLRFNPKTMFSQNYDTLIIRLVPRSLEGYVTADRCASMSFLLAGVKVNVSPAQVTVMPDVSVNYRNLPVGTAKPYMTLMPVAKKEV